MLNLAEATTSGFGDEVQKPSDSSENLRKAPNFSLSAFHTHFNTIRSKANGWTFWLPILLCFYAILKEIKVGEPFMFKYQNEYLNLTTEQLTGTVSILKFHKTLQIYPISPYSYMISLIPIFLLTDLLLYKPIMLMEIIGQIVFRATLVFGGSVVSQIFGQVFFTIASGSEIAFFSYIYAKLEKEQYQKLTSWVRAMGMAGRSFGYLFSQFLILTKFGDLRTLNIISLIIPSVVLIFCVTLPRVHWKLMIKRMIEADEKNELSNTEMPKTYTSYFRFRIRKLGSDFMKIYSIGFIRKWSFWWAMTTCMSLQVALFGQTLWGEVQPTHDNALNGFAEATYTAVATLSILLINSLPINWDKWGELALILISSIDALMLYIFSKTMSIFVMYGCYIVYRSLYQVMITIAQWNIAKKMVCESYGLVFGTNTFIALIMQSLLTIIVSDKRCLGLPIRTQYVVYASLHIFIAAIFVVSVLWSCLTSNKKNSKIQPK